MRRCLPCLAALSILFACSAWASEKDSPVGPEHLDSVKTLPNGTIRITVSFTVHQPKDANELSVDMSGPLKRAAETACKPKGFTILSMDGSNEGRPDGSVVVHDEGVVRCG